MFLEDFFDDELFYFVFDCEKKYKSVSTSAKKLLDDGEDIIGKIIHQTSLSYWADDVDRGLNQALDHGNSLNFIWHIDSIGHIYQFILRCSYCIKTKQFFTLWFKGHDRISNILHAFDRDTKKVILWNGSVISLKEFRTLMYFIKGKSYTAIATKENVSHTTVSARLQSIASKIGYDSLSTLHDELINRLFQGNELPHLLQLFQKNTPPINWVEIEKK